MVASKGFTFLEILVGLVVLALAFISLATYTSSQRKGLNVSGQLSDGTQVAGGPRTFSDHKTVNGLHYAVDLTVKRAPAPLYALQVRAKVTWKSTHNVELGMLFPGAASTL